MAVLRYFHKPPKSYTTTVINNTTDLTGALAAKVDKSAGRGLSQNSYSTPEKTKLGGVEEGAEVNVQSDWNEINTESDAFILNKPDVPILDLSGLIPARYLPSYVDDVLEYPSVSAFPNPGETGKIYVDTSTDLTYRWSGSTYVEISKSILTGVKGDAESTYRVGNVNLTAANIGLGNVANINLSKAIKSITRNGTTFTYTCLDGTAGTFTLQDDNTWRPLGTGATDACAGNDSRLSDSRPASDVYNWAKAPTKPTYDYSEITNTPDIQSILNRIAALENIWRINGNYIEPASNVQQVKGAGFFDTTIS